MWNLQHGHCLLSVFFMIGIPEMAISKSREIDVMLNLMAVECHQWRTCYTHGRDGTQ